MNWLGLALLWAAMVSPLVARAEPFCSVRITVILPDGTPVPDARGVRIEARDDDQKLASEALVRAGVAEFCLLPLGVYSFRIAPRGFYEAEVRRVSVFDEREQHFTLVANPATEFVGESLFGCHVYVRILADSGEAVPDVSLRDMDRARTIVASPNGFTSILVEYDQPYNFSVSREGYVPQEIKLVCPRRGPMSITTVRLRRSH